MVCKSCGKNLVNGTVICPNCGSTLQTISFQTNRLGENGKRAEYITEKYTMKKGVYEGKAHEFNKTYLGVIVLFVVILIILAIAVGTYLV